MSACDLLATAAANAGRILLKLASPPPMALRRFADPDSSSAIKSAR